MTGPQIRKSRPENEKKYAYAAQFGAWAGQAVMMYLAGRARLVGEISPFAPALMAAGMSAGRNPWALLTGAAAGALSQGGGAEWTVFFACAAAWLLMTAAELAGRWHERIRDMRDFISCAAAGAGMLIAGLPGSGGIPYNVLSNVLGSAVSMLLAPALTSGLGVRPSRKRLMPEEQLSMALLMMILLMGLRSAPHAGRFLSQSAAVLIGLVFSGTGAAMGALSGLAAGTALTLGGSDPFIGSALGICGLLAGCVRNLPRAGAGIAFALGNLLTISWGVGYTTGAVDAAPLLAGCALYCLIPERRLNALRGWIRGWSLQGDPENIAVMMRRKAGRRLGEIGDIFGELADGYGEEAALPGERQIISSVRHALCDGCGGYADCWLGEEPRAGRLMCRMAAEALTGKEITPARDLPPDLIRHCRRSAQIDRRAVPLLRALAEERRNALKRGEARSLMGRQFREAQRLIDSLSTQLTAGACVNREYAELVRAALDRAGIEAGEITAILDDRLEIVCAMKERRWNAELAKKAAALLTDELGVPFSPVLTRGEAAGECELRIRQAPALTAAFASVSCPAEDGEECGDSHIVCILPDGRLIAALSDGMGHGERAAAESRKCVSLLRKFVSAGVDRDAALTAVNSLLLMRGGEEMFATADLCVIDLFSGVAGMSKLGACRSYIVSDRGIHTIAGGRLPLGILDQVEPAMEKREVHPGDLMIMISDGVADGMKDGQEEAFKKRLARVRHMRPEEAANDLIGWARKRDEGKERDDMTVIAVRILARRIRKE